MMLGKYSEFIFDVTRKAMKYYEGYFNEPYPFRKYDQIWVRDYENWAMENAGLVTYNEEKMLQPFSTQDDFYNFADTLAHELSHHWFGNLVTMQWWDDLWLNESFADFISHFCLEKINASLLAPLPPSAMYFRDRKAWGYQEDERDSGTHPIRGAVPNTDVAANIFDGITYAKGAAVLKQLVFLLGETSFGFGLQDYFNRFKWGNATIADFLDSMRPYFPPAIPFEDWTAAWLETASLNVFEAVWDPSNLATSATLKLYQTPFSQKFPTMRWHKMQVVLFNANAKVVETQTLLVPPSAEPFIVAYDGSNSPQAVLLNYGDHCFLENWIDPKSLSFFLENINRVNDTFLRAQIWYTIAQLSKQALLPLEDYVGFLSARLFNEPSTFLLDQLLKGLHAYLSDYAPREQLLAHSETISAACYKKLQDMSISDDDLITTLQRHYIRFAETEQKVLQLRKWVMKEDPTIEARDILDEQLPWEVVKKVFAVSDALLPR
jgi:aminopeptidase N